MQSPFTTIKQILSILSIFSIVSCGQSEETSTKKGTDSTGPAPQKIQVQAEQALLFINSYVNNCNKMKGSVGMLEWVHANKLANNHFKSELKAIVDKATKEDPEMGLGFDPILNAQDYPDKGFEFESFDQETNYVVLRGKDWADFKLSLKMVEENKQWLVEGCGIINIPKDKQNFR